MNKQIFKTSRRGWLGREPMGSDYMEQIDERARRLKTACRDKNQSADKRQQRLPGF